MDGSLPPPVELAMTAGERERVRAELFRHAVPVPIVAGVAVLNCGVQAGFAFARYGVRGWLGWVFVAGLAVIVGGAAPVPAMRRRLVGRRREARVAFSDAALELTSAGGGTRTMALRSVRSVEIVADAVLVSTSALLRTPALVIPLRALPDGGDAVMRYFDDRLTAKRMLRRGSASRTKIVNTALRS